MCSVVLQLWFYIDLKLKFRLEFYFFGLIALLAEENVKDICVFVFKKNHLNENYIEFLCKLFDFQI